MVQLFSVLSISLIVLPVILSILLVLQPPNTSTILDNIMPSILVTGSTTGTKFETVGMIPKSYFDTHHVIYGYTERVIDGDTIRVRHIPNYIFRRYVLQTFQPNIIHEMMQPITEKQRGIAQETLSIRLYAIDCPEIGKNKHQSTQPYGIEAKEFTTSLCYQQIVKITLLRKDQYQRAIAVVEVMKSIEPQRQRRPSSSILQRIFPTSNKRRRQGRRTKKKKVDLSMELAKQGLAELYVGGGAEYNQQYDTFVSIIAKAQQQKIGIWSSNTKQRQSAAEYKLLLKQQQEMIKQQQTDDNRSRRHWTVGGIVVDATGIPKSSTYSTAGSGSYGGSSSSSGTHHHRHHLNMESSATTTTTTKRAIRKNGLLHPTNPHHHTNQNTNKVKRNDASNHPYHRSNVQQQQRNTHSTMPQSSTTKKKNTSTATGIGISTPNRTKRNHPMTYNHNNNNKSNTNNNNKKETFLETAITGLELLG